MERNRYSFMMFSQRDSSFPGEETHFRELTPKEKELFVYVGLGLSNTEISVRLFKSTDTIEVQLDSINKKLGIKGKRRESVVAGIHTGVLNLDYLRLRIVARTGADMNKFEGLGEVEGAILDQMVSSAFPQGNSLAHIANRLQSNVKTTEARVASIRHKIGVENQTQLAVLYMAHQRALQPAPAS